MIPTQSALIPKILAKLNSLVSQDVYFKIGPQNEDLPYITFDLISDVIDIKTFDSDFYTIDLQVSVWGSENDMITTHNINDDIHAGLNRYNLAIYEDEGNPSADINYYIFNTTSRGQCEVDKEYVHVWSEYQIKLLSSS